jgi:hypothetical protein
VGTFGTSGALESRPAMPSPKSPVLGWTLKLGRGCPYSLRPFRFVLGASRSAPSSVVPAVPFSSDERPSACRDLFAVQAQGRCGDGGLDGCRGAVPRMKS